MLGIILSIPQPSVPATLDQIHNLIPSDVHARPLSTCLCGLCRHLNSLNRASLLTDPAACTAWLRAQNRIHVFKSIDAVFAQADTAQWAGLVAHTTGHADSIIENWSFCSHITLAPLTAYLIPTVRPSLQWGCLYPHPSRRFSSAGASCPQWAQFCL